ncbi:MAG: hypothetical protein HYV02_04480 [Deltaproteobacteria bacterium]|nr:hypothetical protein [Deltaproteobacteria bacterium]
MTTIRGQVAVLILLLLPLAMLVVALVADVGLVIVTKMRLQVTADRAAYAAAQSLATSLASLATQNAEIHQEFTEQVTELAVSQQQNAAAGRARIAARQATIDTMRTAMDATVERGYVRACEAALGVVEAEAPWARMIPLYGRTRVVGPAAEQRCHGGAPLFSFYQDHLFPDQFPSLSYTYPAAGTGWDDPAQIEEAAAPLLSYRAKGPGGGQQVAFALRLESPLPGGAMGGLLRSNEETAEPTNPWLSAAAAAQPFGGSIADFDPAYDATLVPLDLLRDEDAGYQGLWYTDPDDIGSENVPPDDDTWMRDDGWYLH